MTPTTADHPAEPHPSPALDARHHAAWHQVRRVLMPLASLRLTVVLFAFATVLVFFGTVAMMTQGLWTVVDHYFRSLFVWIPLDLVRRFGTVFLADWWPQTFAKDATPWQGTFPFPGGWLIGGALLVNLLAAHLVRFKLSWKRSGIIILHAGMILLMVGELITGLAAVESTMTIRKGETANFVDVTREFEIAVSTPEGADDQVTLIPFRQFNHPGTIHDEQLPFDLEVVEYWRNTGSEDDLPQQFGGRGAEPFPPGTPDVFTFRFAPVDQDFQMRLTERPESAGVDAEAPSDIPSVRVRALDKQTGAELGNFLLSLWAYPNFAMNRRAYQFPPAKVAVGGKEYTLLLRNMRVYKPYTVELLDFEHGLYPGTKIPKDFASTVRVTDTATGDQRVARIWMNNPLRYQGDSLYQHAVMYGDSGTVLQVVKNPGRLLPYLACTMVTLGMLIHFGVRLSGFQSKRARA